MGAKYCKNFRCDEARKGTRCTASDDCPLFLWDITREKGYKTQGERRLNKNKKDVEAK